MVLSHSRVYNGYLNIFSQRYSVVLYSKKVKYATEMHK